MRNGAPGGCGSKRCDDNNSGWAYTWVIFRRVGFRLRLGLRVAELTVMNEESYYSALGVLENATESEIKAAYRNLLKKIHPDTVSTLSPSLRRMAEDATKEIIEAYSVLSDVSKRRQYDQAGRYRPKLSARRNYTTH